MQKIKRQETPTPSYEVHALMISEKILIGKWNMNIT